MNTTHWLLYLGVVLLSTASPGPAVLLSVSNAVSLGMRASAASSLGNITGLFFLSATVFASIGGLLHVSPTAFHAMKLAGAGYLIYLGFQRWTSRAAPAAAIQPAPDQRGAGSLYAQGAFVALTNPKALLFFGALFPQFIFPATPLPSQFLALTATLMAFSFCALMAYAALASRARRWLAQGQRSLVFNRVSGSLFILLGLAMVRL